MVTPIDLTPLLAIESDAMSKIKPILELLKQLVHDSESDRDEQGRREQCTVYNSVNHCDHAQQF